MSDVSPLHEIRTPDGHTGWQWMNGPAFLYDKDDLDDNAAAQILTLEWAEVAMKIQRLQLEMQRRADRASLEPVILNFEEAKAEHENSGRVPQVDG